MQYNLPQAASDCAKVPVVIASSTVFVYCCFSEYPDVESWVVLFMIQNPELRHRKEDIVHPLRQITTNPMKKGGYGFNKTTLSERKGYKGVVSIT